MPHIAAFPSSEAFDVINSALAADEKERKDAIKQGNAVFSFTLKNKAGETESWHIDLKNKGEVGKGLGDKPTGKPPSPNKRLYLKPLKQARQPSGHHRSTFLISLFEQ